MSPAVFLEGAYFLYSWKADFRIFLCPSHEALFKIIEPSYTAALRWLRNYLVATIAVLRGMLVSVCLQKRCMVRCSGRSLARKTITWRMDGLKVASSLGTTKELASVHCDHNIKVSIGTTQHKKKVKRNITVTSFHQFLWCFFVLAGAKWEERRESKD